MRSTIINFMKSYIALQIHLVKTTTLTKKYSYHVNTATLNPQPRPRAFPPRKWKKPFERG